ncbi:MAG: PKD domain-containing protein [Bacteroidia bacterium]
MNKYTNTLRCVVFSVAALLSFSAFAQQSFSSLPYSDYQNEIISRRDANSKHFRNADGSVSMFTQAGLIHYKNEQGQWLDIDTRISPAVKGFSNTANTVKSFFPDAINEGGQVTTTSSGEIKEMLNSGWRFSDQENSHPLNFINPWVVENVISYQDNAGIKLNYTLSSSRKKMDWIIEQSSFLKTSSEKATTLVFSEEIQLPAGAYLKQKGEELEIVLSSGEVLVNYERPLIHEAGKFVLPEDAQSAVYGFYHIKQLAQHRYLVETHIPMTWLKDAARVFPVVVDPTANYYPNSVNFWTGYQTSASSKSNGFLRITTALNVGWAKFNISSIPLAATINQTRLYSYHYQTTGTKDARVNDMNATDPVAAAAGTISGAIAANDAYITNYPYGATSYGWRNAILGSAANTDVKNRIAQGWTAMGLNYVSGSTSFMYHYGWNAASSANRPYLQITYVDAIVDLNVDAVISPVTNSCGEQGSRIILRIKNNSATQNITGAVVVCNLSGGVVQSLSATLNRTLLAGTTDTLYMPGTYNFTSGSSFTLSAYTDYVNDPNHVNDTLTQSFTIHPLPLGSVFSKSVSSQGTHGAGIFASPDYVKAGDSIVYNFSAPTGYTDAQYGTDWQVSSLTSVKTLSGTSMAMFYVLPPSGSNSARLVLKPGTVEIDSSFEINLFTEFIATGCKTNINRFVFIAPVPVAGFESTLACDGFPISFKDTSAISSGSLSFFWNFGDVGNADTSVVQNPEYTYSGPGVYTVTLTVTSDLGYTAQKTTTVEVGDNPHAVFTSDNTCDKSAVQFTNGTTIPGSVTLSYEWNFGDGTTSTQINPSRLYAAAGVYTATLKATSSIGCSSIYTRQVTVSPYPVAAFNVNDACAGQDILFTNTSTISFGSVGQEWQFGSGIISNDKNPKYSFATAGTYNVKLRAISDFGCVDSVIKQVVVHAVPMPAFTVADVCNGEDAVITNTSLLSGSSNGFDSYWNLGDGDTTTNNSPSFSHLYDLPGTYTIQLNTSTAYCTSVLSKNIIVKSVPQSMFDIKTQGCVNGDIGLTNNSSSAKQYYWSFSDNTSSTDEMPEKSFAVSGSYTVKLVTAHESGCTDTLIKNIVVNNLPNAAFTFVKNSPSDQRQVSFTPSLNTFDTYAWDMGDGNTYNQISPVHSFTSNGPFVVQLAVTDVNGCVNNSTQQIMFNVSVEEKALSGLMIYPSPATHQITISGVLPDAGMKMEIYNSLGQKQQVAINAMNASGSFEINTGSFANGLYHVKVLTSGGFYSGSFVILK